MFAPVVGIHNVACIIFVAGHALKHRMKISVEASQRVLTSAIFWRQTAKWATMWMRLAQLVKPESSLNPEES